MTETLLLIRAEHKKYNFDCRTLFTKIFINLYHSSEKFINFIFSVSKVTTFYIMVGFLTPSAIWCIELETIREMIFRYNILI